MRTSGASTQTLPTQVLPVQVMPVAWPDGPSTGGWRGRPSHATITPEARMDDRTREAAAGMVTAGGVETLLDRRLSLVSVVYLLAGVSATCVLSLLIFYAVEVPRGSPHLFGPTSDLTTSLWNLLLTPLLVASVAALNSRGGRILIWITVILSVIGAAGSMLLVIDAVPFGLSTPVSVAAVLAQAAWVYALCESWRRLQERAAANLRMLTLGRLMGLGQWVGALLVGISFVFGWGTPLQRVIMVVGLIPGALSWMAWPVWFAMLGRSLGRVGGGQERP
jgi:hypothetical protein